MKGQDLLMAGVGGQGIILASDILCTAALACGYDVKKTDTLGMAQRGGSVISHVRLAGQVCSPLIREGEAHLLVAFEKLEAARWAHYLSPGGLAIINDHSIPPQSVSLGGQRYPSDQEIRDILKGRAGSVLFVPGTQRAMELGNVRVLNIFILGYLSSFMSLKVRTWKDCISQYMPKGILAMNLAAFDQGRREARSIGYPAMK